MCTHADTLELYKCKNLQQVTGNATLADKNVGFHQNTTTVMSPYTKTFNVTAIRSLHTGCGCSRSRRNIHTVYLCNS